MKAISELSTTEMELERMMRDPETLEDALALISQLRTTLEWVRADLNKKQEHWYRDFRRVLEERNEFRDKLDEVQKLSRTKS